MGQGDLHARLGLSTMGSKKKTRAHLVPCSTSTSQMDTISVSRGMVRWFMGEKDNGSGPEDRHIWRDERGREWAEMMKELNP